MTIQQLKIFLSVCRELNYTRAAEACFITRQALRQSISALETELGAPLFFMESNRISLTDLGEKLRDRSAPVVAAFTDLEAEIRSGSVKRSLNVGISVSLIPDYLPRLMDDLRAYAERNTSVVLKTSVMPNDELEPALLEGILDCALTLDLGCCGSGISRSELSRHRSALMVSKKSPLWELESVCAESLQGLSICAPGIGPAFAPLIDLASEKAIRIVESYYQVYYLVREENAVAVNRYAENEHDVRGHTKNIVIHDLPCLCCSFITASANGNSETSGLEKYLKREIRKNFP